MSFGFSAGDFVTCLVLIKNVAQALNDSTGSVADFKALMRTLESLEHGLVTSEVVYQQWEKLDIAPEFKRNTVAMTNGIHFERQQCKEILESFIKSLTPYADAFVKGRGMALIRQVRKVTWTFRKDEVGKLDRDLEGHLKTLRMYTEALFQIQMADNAKAARAAGTKVNEILSSIIDLRADITSISATVRSGTAKMPFGLGYPWERSAALAENVLLHDAIGRKVLLPMMLLSTPSILHEILIVMYRGVPGRRRILRKEYTITDEDVDGVLVEETNWSSVIHEGMQLSLNIVLPASSSWNIHRCPRCDEPALGNTLHDQRRRCHKCQLTFRIFDRERVIEEPESESTTDPKADEPESQHEARVAASRKSASSKDSRRIGQSMKKDDDDDHFKLVHYFRDVQISKAVPKIDTIPEDERVFEINDLPPLHQAAAKGLVADIVTILSSGEDVNMGLPFQMVIPADKGGYRFGGCTPLHLACYFDKIKAIDILLAHGASIGALDSDGAGIITSAICGESRGRIVLPLLSRGADVNCRNHSKGNIPLHYACELGIAWLIHVLVERGPDLDDRNTLGETPLHRAAKRGHAEVVQVLLEEGAEVQVTETVDGWTPLHCASYFGSEKVVNVLLQHEANLMDLDLEGDTPLHLACMKGNEGVIKALLAHGANISARNSQSWGTPLHVASVFGKKAAAQLLLDSGADILAVDKWKESVILKAAWLGHHDVVQLLLNRGADVTAKTLEGCTALICALHNKHEAVANLLLEQGADANIISIHTLSPLHYASLLGFERTVELLLQHGADISAQDIKTGVTPLHAAALGGKEKIIKMLLDNGAEIHHQDLNGHIALEHAAANGNESSTKLLIERGASVNHRDNDGRSALHLACCRGHESVVGLLLDQGAESFPDESGNTPLHDAAWRGSGPIVQMLLQHGADANARDNGGMSALIIAAIEDFPAVTKLLVEGGLNPEATRYEAKTALSFAVALHRPKTVDILLKDQNHVILCDEDGFIPWISKPSGVDVKDAANTLEVLLQHGWNKNEQDADGVTSLHQAAWDGNGEITQLLINLGCDLYVRDKGGDTPLHFAVLRKHDGIATVLLNAMKDDERFDQFMQNLGEDDSSESSSDESVPGLI